MKSRNQSKNNYACITSNLVISNDLFETAETVKRITDPNFNLFIHSVSSKNLKIICNILTILVSKEKTKGIKIKKTIILIAFIILATIGANSQTIYSKAFGDPNNEPVIYLHGGPGYNSIGFAKIERGK